MKRLHRIATILAVLAGTTLILAATTTAAFAERVPPPDDIGFVPSLHTITKGGTPGWQITLIALAAALAAATVAVLLDRAWMARRNSTATA
jgi:hypothetical protein